MFFKFFLYFSIFIIIWLNLNILIIKLFIGENMKLSKIMILAITLFLAVGIVAAVDVSDLNAPSNFKSDDGYFYETNALGLMDENGVVIDIFTDKDLELAKNATNATEQSFSDYFVNDTESKYTVESTDDANIFSFEDGINELKGYVELVKIGDEQVVIESSVSSNASDDSLNKSLDSLKEFNELNNFELLDPSSL